MILLVQKAFSTDSQRQAEYDLCLETNLQSSWFSHIHVIDGRPAFRQMFHIANEKFAGEVIVIANSDITFDESIRRLGKLARGTFVALTRWENKNQFYGRKDSQDAWVFRAPIAEVEADFTLGLPGCDNRIAYLLKEAGYKVINPSLEIKILHHHTSRVRSYRKEERVPGPYLYLNPSKIGLRVAQTYSRHARLAR